MPLLSTVRFKSRNVPAGKCAVPSNYSAVPIARLCSSKQLASLMFQGKKPCRTGRKTKNPLFFPLLPADSPFRAQADALPSAPLAHYIDRAVREGGYGDKWASE
jgi:hypothetical protein